MLERNIVCSFVLATKERKRPSQRKASFAAQGLCPAMLREPQHDSLHPSTNHRIKIVILSSWKDYQSCVLTFRTQVMLAQYFNSQRKPALSCAAITGFETCTTIVAQGAAGSFLGTSFDGQKKYKS